MNKLFSKIAALSVGLALAIGIGVSLGSGSIEATKTQASYSGTYTLVESSTGIAAGDTIILVNHSGNRALSTIGTASTKYGQYATVSVSNKTITLTNNTVVAELSVEAGSDTGTFSFKGSSSNPTTSSQETSSSKNTKITNYLYWSSGNSLTQNSTKSANTSWTLSYSSTNGMTITNKADLTSNPNATTNRHIRYNTASGQYRFATYASTAGELVDIYKKNVVSSDTIDSFNVTSTPTYSRGDTPAVTGWTVTANLKDKANPVTITSGLSFATTPSTNTVGSINVTLRYTAASGPYALTNGNATADISTTMTVNPQQASVEFKQSTYTIAPNGTLTLADEVNESGDGDLTFSITSGSEYVSISNGVLTATAIGTATIKVVKQYSTYSSLKDEDTATINVSNVATWSYTFAAKVYSSEGSQTLEGTTNVSWSLSIVSSATTPYYGYESDRGQQFGSGSAQTSKATLSTKGFESVSEIQTIKVEAAMAKDGDASLSVSVGGDDYTTLVNSSPVTSVSLTTTSTVYTFTGESNGEISISLTQTTSKGMYIKSIQVIYDNSPIVQTGIKASWGDGKGTYYNGSITATTTFSTQHLVINTTTGSGKIYGDANTTGAGFKTYLKNSAGKWVKADKTISDAEVVFIDSSSALGTQAMTGFTAGTYSLYVTTPKDGGGVWTSDTINFSIVAKAPSTITKASEPTKTEFVAYVDTFVAFSGKINVVYNDTAADNNRSPVIKYYNGANEVDISTLLNESNKFAVNSNTTLTVRLYDDGYVGGDYIYASYTLYIYVGTFSCTDGNGEGAEYESGGTVALNPNPIISYTDKDSTAQVINLSSSDVDLYIKTKGASGDGELYSGTMPEVSESTEYTITAVYKGNSSYKGTYDIEVVNATFSIDASGATKSYIFGTNFTKTGLVVQIQYGSASPTTIDPANYTCEDENGNELDVIKFIGIKTVTVRYKGYSATYEITSTNVGSSETYVHDDIPGEWEGGTPSYVTYQSATNTCTSKNTLLPADGFDYGTVTSNNTYNALLNGSSIIGKNNAFNSNVVKSITFSMNIKVDTQGPKFTFTLAAISNNVVSTTYVATGSEITAKTSNTAVSVTINNIPYDANVTGWYLTVAKSGSGNNAQFNSMRVDYTPYVKGDDQTFNSTPSEQALSYAAYFLEITAEYCTVSLTTETKTLLSNEYNGMVSAAKTLFTSATIVRGKGVTYENDLSEALSRYVNMVEEKGTGDFLSLGNSVLQKGINNPFALSTKNTSAVIVIVAISAISLAAVGGYFFFRKKKEN